MDTQVPPAVVSWLLEPDNQPVRYLTLTRLLGKPEKEPEVRQARAACSSYSPTRAILAQLDEFRNDDKTEAYRKYTGRYWQIIFLGQFYADGTDPRIRGLAEALVADQDWQLIPRGGHCLTANLLGALALLGYATHPAVKEATVQLARRLVRDGGIACEVMEYSLLPHCYMAGPKQLLCFAANPAIRRSPGVTAAVNLIRESLVEHGVLTYVPGHKAEWMDVLAKKPDKAKLGGRTVRSWVAGEKKELLARKGLGTPTDKPGWLKPGFPLHYNSDLLEGLYALALCGTRPDPRLERPLQLLRSKMLDGRVTLETSLNGKMRADVETVGKPSKWLTYRAWHVLRHFGLAEKPVV